MDLYSLRFVAFCCCFSFLLKSCAAAGDVCLPTWNTYTGRHSIGGTQYHLTTLQDCIVYCEYRSECVAVDFDTGAHPPCWVHTDAENLVGENVYDTPGDSVTQYVINRTCTKLPTGDCQLNWTRVSGLHSSNGQPYDFWTEYDCFNFCRYTSNCVAADFDIAGNPACWIHTSVGDLTPDNTFDDSSTVVQYQMNRTCPTPQSADIQVGRCIGQPIKNGTWCPSGKQISIVSASYKVHPLCCNSPTDNSDPPDSRSLDGFDLFVMGNTSYIAELSACEGRNACSVFSKSFNHSTFINNPYCPQQSYKTNFVSVTYACVALGYIRPSTTKSLTSFQFPTESLSTQRTGMPPSPGVMCLLSWTRFPNRYSVGGSQQRITDLQQCIVACQLRSDCLAVDFDTGSNPPCWIHTNPGDLVGDNLYDSAGDVVAQYVTDRTCTTLPTADCLLNWSRVPGLHSSNGQPYDFWTEYDCFTFCRYTSNCVAADFDIAGNPACWIHTSVGDLTSDNTFDDSTTVVQYRMNRTCPTPQSAVKNISRCIGQTLRSGDWCSSGEEIHILSASYKIHPLCCNSPADNSDAPDSPTLAKFSVFNFVDELYQAEIEHCEGETSCSVTSKAYESDVINNVYCPNHVHKTNFVSLTYSCVKSGHSDPSTTQSLTSFQFSADKTFSMEGTHHVTTMSDGSPMAERVSSLSNNRDALILAGIAIALAIIAILAVVVLAVCWYRQDQGKHAETMSQVALNPVYNDYPNHNPTHHPSSTISGVSSSNGRYAGSPLKDMTTIAYPENDTLSAKDG
jgi:hypothetical protein